MKRPRTALRAAALLLLTPWAAATAETSATAPANTAAETKALAAFARASAEWGAGVEAVIEDAYRRCFRTVLVDGRFVTLRMPFGENNERSELAETQLAVIGGGKADPAGSGPPSAACWTPTTSVVTRRCSSTAARRSWCSTSRRAAGRPPGTGSPSTAFRTGAYPGLPHKPYVLVRGRGVTAADVYNYLYCVGRVGMDCSGFVWHVLTSVARAGGLDLGKTFGRFVGAARSADASKFVGTWFFDPRNTYLEEVKDEIRNLRPADVIVFRGDDGTTRHSAVIQSVDRARGTIRYLQSTDESPQDERGVHESLITFDPAHPEATLDAPTVTWHQLRGAAFDGEGGVWFRDDGERYRAYPEHGGGTVVRLKALAKVVAKLSTPSR